MENSDSFEKKNSYYSRNKTLQRDKVYGNEKNENEDGGKIDENDDSDDDNDKNNNKSIKYVKVSKIILGSGTIRSMLLWSNPETKIKISKIAISLYILSSIFDIGIAVWLLVFTYLGFSPSWIFYGYMIFHLPHLFSWVSIFACLSRSYNQSWFSATMVLYFLMIIFDLIGALWGYISTALCDNTSSQCIEYLAWGYVQSSISILLGIWSLVAFILLYFLNRQLVQFVLEKIDDDVDIKNEIDTQSLNPAIDKLLANYKNQLSKSPPPASDFTKRSILFQLFQFELILYYLLVIIFLLGLVPYESMMWGVYLESIHLFSWNFGLASIHDNFSKPWHIITIVLYFLNFCCDTASFIWRIIAILECDSSLNVDCIFRTFPNTFPLLLFTGWLWCLDIGILFCLSSLYAWKMDTVWIPSQYFEKKVDDIIRAVSSEPIPSSQTVEDERNIIDINDDTNNRENLKSNQTRTEEINLTKSEDDDASKNSNNGNNNNNNLENFVNGLVLTKTIDILNENIKTENPQTQNRDSGDDDDDYFYETYQSDTDDLKKVDDIPSKKSESKINTDTIQHLDSISNSTNIPTENSFLDKD